MKDSKKSLADHLRQFMWDISGAFADMGVLFPVTIALITKNGFNPAALFLTAGLFYIASSYYFRVTMPVQPLKAMSAIAIATGLNTEVVNAAGIILGVILLIISITGLSVELGSLFPVTIIRGIQLGLGMMLVKASFNLLSTDIPISLAAGAILIISIFLIKRMPPLIPLLILGIVFSLKDIEMNSIGPLAIIPLIPDQNNLWIGFTFLVLPQVALTATSQRSGYIIGSTLVVLALLFGSSILSIISVFPKGILGVLLCYVGIQHSLLVRDISRDKAGMFIANFKNSLNLLFQRETPSLSIFL